MRGPACSVDLEAVASAATRMPAPTDASDPAALEARVVAASVPTRPLCESILADLAACAVVGGDWGGAARYALEALERRDGTLYLDTGLTRWLEAAALVRAGHLAAAEADLCAWGPRLEGCPRYRLPYLRALAFEEQAIAIDRLNAAFVGRQAQLDRLLRAWEQARQGQTGWVLLAAPPGFGKTRACSSRGWLQSKSGVSVSRLCQHPPSAPARLCLRRGGSPPSARVDAVHPRGRCRESRASTRGTTCRTDRWTWPAR